MRPPSGRATTVAAARRFPYIPPPSMTSRKSIARAALLVLVLGCRPPPPTGAAIVLGLEAPPETLDRRMALSTNAMRLCQLVTPGLTRIDERGQAVPDLAASFAAPDPRTWEFTLREGLVFSDGTPLTAEDVAATFRSVLDPATKSPHRSGYAYVETVEADGPLLVRFRLKTPFGALPVDATLGVLPSRLLAEVEKETVRKRPIGAGPYVVERWDDEDRLVLAPNPRYGGDVPRHWLEVRTVRDETTRVLELRKGRVDVIFNAVSPALLPALREEEVLSVEVGPGNGVSYLMFNLEDPVTGKPEVRQAIAHALDREALARFKYKGAARPATSLLPPEHWAHEPGLPAYGRDLARAKALLDQAGLPDPDGDGPLPRVTLRYKTSTDRFRRSLALVMQAQLAEAGIAVELSPLEWGTFMTDVKRGNFQLASLKWPVIDPDLHRLAYHSSSIPTPENAWGGGNRMRYRNAALDELLDRARELADPAERRALYAEAQRIVARDLPALPLLWEDAIAVRRRGLEGVTLDPYGSLRTLASARRVVE